MFQNGFKATCSVKREFLLTPRFLGFLVKITMLRFPWKIHLGVLLFVLIGGDRQVFTGNTKLLSAFF